MKPFLLTSLFIFIVAIGIRSQAALSESVCATLVVNELKATNPGIDAGQEAKMITQWTSICKGILDHIKSAAVVITTTVGVATGVTSGPAAAPTAGTGTGAIQ